MNVFNKKFFLTFFIFLSFFLLFSACIQSADDAIPSNEDREVEQADGAIPSNEDREVEQADGAIPSNEDREVEQEKEPVSNLCGNNVIDTGENCSSCPKDVKCKSNEKCVGGNCVLKMVDLIGEDKYPCDKICEKDEFCNSEGKCEKVELTNLNFCGNFVCEETESYSGNILKVLDLGKECYFDCEAPCTSEYCNDVVEIDCGCSDYEALADRHGCIKETAKPCTDCGVQATLFPKLLEIQTEIFNCLVDYFKFRPNRLIYKVFNNPDLEKCTNKEGCEGIEGGAGGADYVMFHNLNGFREFGEVTPTKPEHLVADVHETTHYFLYQMLHGIPSWFHEVMAIQTNERLDCSDAQSSWGDHYLPYKEGNNGGINMDDGTLLTEDFYNRLKEGKTSLSEEEKKNHYITAVLFIYGMKLDYECGFYCLRDIVLKLREYELKACASDASKCAVQKATEEIFFTTYIGGSEEKANELIKQAADEVTGKDTSPLFNLLGIGKYKPLPSPCGPTSTCEQ